MFSWQLVWETQVDKELRFLFWDSLSRQHSYRVGLLVVTIFQGIKVSSPSLYCHPSIAWFKDTKERGLHSKENLFIQVEWTRKSLRFVTAIPSSVLRAFKVLIESCKQISSRHCPDQRQMHFNKNVSKWRSVCIGKISSAMTVTVTRRISCDERHLFD